MVEAPVPFGNAAARWYYVLLRELVARGHRVTAFAAFWGYVVVCGRTDHAMQPDGVVTDDGYFVGPERQSFREAATDRRGHQHVEAIVVRCSTADSTCGPIWPLQ